MSVHEGRDHVAKVAQGCKRQGDSGGLIVVTHRLGTGHQVTQQRAHPHSRRQRVKMRIRSSLRDGLKEFSAYEIRMMALEAWAVWV